MACTMIDSYPQVYSLGHKALTFLLSDPVVVQEKVDGSQFSFMKVQDHEIWEVIMRSKGAKVTADNPGMFKLAVEAVTNIAALLHPGWVYRAEYLSKPKHNVLAYDRIPRTSLILYDIQIGDGDFLDPGNLQVEGDRLGIEVVPLLFSSYFTDSFDLADFNRLLELTSVLGGQKVEGIVIKNYTRFGFDKKPLFGKFVSEKFKETHAKEWKNQNPASADILELLTARFRSEARWQKAVQHLEERGELEGSPRDIGKLFKEVPTDLLKECKEEIMEILFDWAWKRKLSRSLTAGLAEWYKLKLAERQFTAVVDEQVIPDDGAAAAEAQALYEFDRGLALAHEHEHGGEG